MYIMFDSKPTTFASCQVAEGRTVLFFCLPGNPVSATVTCHLYVLPTLRQLAGHKNIDGLIVKAQVSLEGSLVGGWSVVSLVQI